MAGSLKMLAPMIRGTCAVQATAGNTHMVSADGCVDSSQRAGISDMTK